MKISCASCANEDQSKFAPTKKGFICLVCFEKDITKTPENATEKAIIDIENHLSRPTGGNNRKFARAYKAMRDKLVFLDSLPERTDSQNYFIQGYAEAIKTFESEA